MLVAKIINDLIIVQPITEMSPNTSFSVFGPDEEFFNHNNLLKVSQFIPHDRDTEKLEYCTPYVQDNIVYVVKVVPLT